MLRTVEILALKGLNVYTCIDHRPQVHPPRQLPPENADPPDVTSHHKVPNKEAFYHYRGRAFQGPDYCSFRGNREKSHSTLEGPVNNPSSK